MTTNQENIVATIETLLGLSGLNYNEAIMLLAADQGIAVTNFNSMFAQYLQGVLSSSTTNLPGLLAEYAALNFDGNVNSINDLTIGIGANNFIFQDTNNFVFQDGNNFIYN